MKARHVMKCYPSIAEASTSVSHAAQIMRDHRVRILPVVDDLIRRRLVGVVTQGDLARRGASPEERGHEAVSRYMTTGPIARVHRDADLEEVRRLMTQTGLRRVPVVAEDDRVIGIISSHDLEDRDGADPVRGMPHTPSREAALV